MVKTGIYHEKVASEDNRYGIDDLNAKHKSFNLLGYELVEEKKDLSGVSSVTFSGLNGDEDIEYLLEVNGLMLNGATDNQLYIVPNSANSGLHSIVSRSYGSGTDSTYYTRMSLLRCGFSKNNNVTLKCYIPSKSGRIRIGRCVFSSVAYDITGIIDGNSTIVFANSVDVINSLSVLCLNNSFSGDMLLWKKIPLE